LFFNRLHFSRSSPLLFRSAPFPCLISSLSHGFRLLLLCFGRRCWPMVDPWPGRNGAASWRCGGCLMVAAAGGCSTGLGLLAMASATLELTGALRKKTERRPGSVCDGGRNCRR
jgi:hypothetical protein